MGKYVYVRDKKTKAGRENPGFWPESKRIEVVTAYLTLGSLPLASATTKVPFNTIQHWKKQPWWKEIESKIKDEDNQELDTKFTKIIKKTLDVIDDRLENGNFQFDPKTGRVMRIPVNIRDTHRVMSDLVNQRRVIRKEPTVVEDNKDKMNDRLLSLAEQFAKFALGKTIDDTKIIPGEVVYDGDAGFDLNASQTALEPLQDDNGGGDIPTPTPDQTNGS